MSKLEEKVITLLKKDKIRFEREKQFPDLKKHGNFLRFDFYVPSRHAILEVNGAQHYHQVKKFQNARVDFLKQQEYDRHKISWCLAHGIEIYCIPYWRVDELKSAADLFSDEFKAKSRWKNDTDWSNFRLKK